MRTLQLYGTASATANAVAQVTIPAAATLKAVSWDVAVDCVTDNGHVALELSKVPTSQIATNGAQDPFLELRHFTNFATSGLFGAPMNGQTMLKTPCRQGELVYLHAYVSGTLTFYANFILWF